MTDNVLLNLGSGGQTVASDDVGGLQFQRIKVTVGADGAADDVTVATPFPVRLSDGTNFLTSKNPGADHALSVAILDGAGNQVTSFGGAGGTSSQDDTAFSAGIGFGTPMMGIATSDNVDVNDAGVIGMTVAREMFTTLRTSIPAGTNNIGDVDVITVPADPFGLNADAASATGSISAKLRFIASTGIPVTAMPALAAGAATVGSIASITTAVVPGTSSSNLGKAIDNVAGAADTGVAQLMTRVDTLSTLTPAVGDYANPRINSQGAQWVQIAGGTIAGIIDDSAFGVGTSELLAVGHLCDETATDSVDEGDIGLARMTADRKTITTPFVHAASGGTSAYSSISTAAVLSAVVKALPGKVFQLSCMNINAAARYVRLYNQTGAPASTDGANILWRGIIPGATTGAGFTIPLNGIQFSTGIGIRASTGIADTDTGSLAANELIFNVEYA